MIPRNNPAGHLDMIPRAPDACAMKPSAAKTPIPASSSKPEFDRPTTSADPDMSVFRSTYEEYVIMIPNPTASEEKIWPKAAAHTDGSFSVDQFGANSASRPSAAPGRNRART